MTNIKLTVAHSVSSPGRLLIAPATPDTATGGYDVLRRSFTSPVKGDYNLSGGGRLTMAAIGTGDAVTSPLG